MWGERRGDRPPLGDVAAGAAIPRHRPPRQGRNRSLARRASGPAPRGALRTPGQPGVPPGWPPRRPTWGEHRARAGEFWSARRLTEGGRPGRVVRHHPARLPVPGEHHVGGRPDPRLAAGGPGTSPTICGESGTTWSLRRRAPSSRPLIAADGDEDRGRPAGLGAPAAAGAPWQTRRPPPLPWACSPICRRRSPATPEEISQ